MSLIEHPEAEEYDGCSCDNCHFGNIPGMEEWCMFGGGVFPKMAEHATTCCHRWRQDYTNHDEP